MLDSNVNFVITLANHVPIILLVLLVMHLFKEFLMLGLESACVSLDTMMIMLMKIVQFVRRLALLVWMELHVILVNILGIGSLMILLTI